MRDEAADERLARRSRPEAGTDSSGSASSDFRLLHHPGCPRGLVQPGLRVHGSLMAHDRRGAGAASYFSVCDSFGG